MSLRSIVVKFFFSAFFRQSLGFSAGSTAAVVATGGFGFFPKKDAIDKDRQRDADDSKGGVSLPVHLIKSPSVSRFGTRVTKQYTQILT